MPAMEMSERRPTHTIDDDDAMLDKEPLVASTAGKPAEKEERENPFGSRSRLSMFILLSAIAVSAVMFGAKEQQAEDKIWKADMNVVKNGTDVGDQHNMRYSTVAGMSWKDSTKMCAQYSGATLCNFEDICGLGGKALKALCPQQKCVGLQTPEERKTRLVPIGGKAPGSYVHVDNCALETKSVGEEVPTVIACCGTTAFDGTPVKPEAFAKFQQQRKAYSDAVREQQKQKRLHPQQKTTPITPPKPPARGMKRGLLAVHQAPVVQSAVLSGKIATGKKRNANGGEKQKRKGGPNDLWAVQGHMRENDPFVKSKEGGGKGLKSFHKHMASHLSNETVTTMTQHFNNFAGAMTNLVNSIKASVKVEDKNQTATHGSLTHSIRQSDPFMKGGSKTKVKPLHEHLGFNTTETAASVLDTIKGHAKNLLGAGGAPEGAESIRNLEVAKAKEEEAGEGAKKNKGANQKRLAMATSAGAKNVELGDGTPDKKGQGQSKGKGKDKGGDGIPDKKGKGKDKGKDKRKDKDGDGIPDKKGKGKDKGKDKRKDTE